VNADKIIANCADKAKQHSSENWLRLSFRVAMLEGYVRDLCAQLTPQPDKQSSTLESWIDGERVLIEYDYTPPEEPIYNFDSPMCGPGCAAEVSITAVWIRGACIEPSCFAQAYLDRWGQEAIDSENAATEEQHARRHEREYE
jgi:hypothetical protein